MKTRRRDLAILIAVASSSPRVQGAPADALPSATYVFEDLPVRQNSQNRSRSVLNGATGSGYGIEMHHTEIAPGKAPHAPHRHVHEEVLVLREGSLEVNIEGKVSKIGPGGVIYVASNEMHGWTNVGTTPAHYLVMTLGRKVPR